MYYFRHMGEEVPHILSEEEEEIHELNSSYLQALISEYELNYQWNTLQKFKENNLCRSLACEHFEVELSMAICGQVIWNTKHPDPGRSRCPASR